MLKPGTDIRAMWSRAPFAVDFLIYVFNVTNPEAVIAGGKPVVQQIGPYYFEYVLLVLICLWRYNSHNFFSVSGKINMIWKTMRQKTLLHTT